MNPTRVHGHAALLALLALSLGSGCSLLLNPDCESDDDCQLGVCVSGTCDTSNSGGGGGGAGGEPMGGEPVGGEPVGGEPVGGEGGQMGGAGGAPMGGMSDAGVGGMGGMGGEGGVGGEGMPDMEVDAGPDMMPPEPQAPDCNILSPGPGTLLSGLEAEVQVLVTDADTAPEALAVTLNDAPVTLDAEGLSTVLLPVGEGAQEIVLTAIDEGDRQCRATITITVDRTPPALSPIVPEGGQAFTSLRRFPVIFRAVDEVSGLQQNTLLSFRAVLNGVDVPRNRLGLGAEPDEFTLDANLIEGENSIQIHAEDRVGNETVDPLSIVLTLDLDDPTLAVNSPVAGSLLADNDVQLTGQVQDNLGNDRVRLELAIVNVRTGQRSEQVIAPNEDGTFSVDIELFEGENDLILTATDRAGNDVRVTRRVEVDTSPPNVEITSPDEEDVVVSETVTVTVEARPFVSGVTLSVPGAPDVAAVYDEIEDHYTADVQLPGLGRHTITAVATNEANRQNEDTVTVFLDNTGPQITIDRPGNGACIGTDPMEVCGRALDPETQVLTARVSAGGDTQAALLGFDGAFCAEVSVGLVEGSNIPVRASGENLGGLTGESTIVVNIDRVPPSLFIDTPIGDSFVDGSTGVITLTGRTFDANCGGLGNDALRYGEQIIPLQPDNDGNLNQFELDIDAVEGLNEITLTATDTLGNTRPRSVSFTVDSIQPVIDLVEPLEDARITTAAQISVSATVLEEGSDLRAVTLNGLNFPDRFFNQQTGLTEVRGVQNLSEGNNLIRVIAVDNVGLQSELSFEVLRDSTAPIIVVDHPTAQQNVEGRVDVAGTFDDTAIGSGVVQILVNGEEAEIDVEAGTWRVEDLVLTPNVDDGEASILVQGTDLAGNASNPREVRVRVRDFAALNVEFNGLRQATGVGWVGAADLNEDGHLDILALPEDAGGQIGVYAQLASGQYVASDALAAGLQENLLVNDAALGDVNNDGHVDLVTASPLGQNFLYLGDGQGGFELDGDTNLVNAASSAVALCDLNRDRRLDLAFLAGEQSAIYFQDIDGAFTSQPLGDLGIDGITDAVDLTVLDFTRDGLQDITATGAGAAFWQAQGDGTFSQLDAVASGFESRPGARVLVFDADRDGDLDVVHLEENQIIVYTNVNLASEWSASPINFNRPGGVIGMTFGDLNGDSRDDLVLYGQGGLDLYYQRVGVDESIEFVVPGENSDLGIPPLGEVRHAELVDIDTDGDLDIITASANGIAVLKSNLTFKDPDYHYAIVEVRRAVLGEIGPEDAVGVVISQDLVGGELLDRAIPMPATSPLVLTLGADEVSDITVRFIDLFEAGSRSRTQNVSDRELVRVTAPE